MPTGLKRPRYPMPEFIRTALIEKNLMEAYLNRPAYRKMTILAGLLAPKETKLKKSVWHKCLMNFSVAIDTWK